MITIVDYRTGNLNSIRNMLKKIGVPTKMIQYQGMPHGISCHSNNVHRMLNELRWWKLYLKPGKTT